MISSLQYNLKTNNTIALHYDLLADTIKQHIYYFYCIYMCVL